MPLLNMLPKGWGKIQRKQTRRTVGNYIGINYFAKDDVTIATLHNFFDFAFNVSIGSF